MATATASKAHWILFLLSPFITLLLAFRNRTAQWSKNVLWAFTTFYGFTFVISNENANSDINRYLIKFNEMAELNLSIPEFIGNYLYNVETGTADIFQPILTYLVASFTNIDNIYIATFGLVYGYFYSRNLWFVLDKLKGNLKPYTFLLIVVFSVIIPIWSINGFRFWTASHMFFFGVIPFLLDGNRKRLIVAFLTVFVHFTFFVPVAILLIYLIVGNRLKILFLFFILSLFVNNLNISSINRVVETYLPTVFVDRSQSYIDEEHVEAHRQSTGPDTRNWYAQLYTVALKWSVISLILLIFFYGSDVIRKNRSWLRLFSFILLFYGIANIVALIPAGGRFIVLANLFSLAMFIFYIHSLDPRGIFNLSRYILIPLLILFVVVTIRVGFNSFGVITVLGNPLIAIFSDNEMALIELIK